jgi:hypothetical protein
MDWDASPSHRGRNRVMPSASKSMNASSSDETAIPTPTANVKKSSKSLIFNLKNRSAAPSAALSAPYQSVGGDFVLN